MLSKASRIYIIMLGTFGIGLWIIITLGTVLLHAPTDLSGSWQLHAQDSDQEMIVEQSGLFFDVKIGDKHYAMTRPDRHATPILLTGRGLQLVFVQQPTGAYTLQASGDFSGQWAATRSINKAASNAHTRS